MRPWTSICICVVTIFGASMAFSTPVLSPINKLDSSIDHIRTVRQLPDLDSNRDISIHVTVDTIPEEVLHTFNDIQQFVFSRTDLINLRTCEGCEAISDAHTKSIYVDLKFLPDIQAEFPDAVTSILKFILAHEISHFTYDYLTLMAKDGLSPNGHIPLLRRSFLDFVDFNEYVKSSAANQSAVMSKYLRAASEAHAEVDTIAILTLKKMGLDVSSVAKSFLESQISNPKLIDAARADFRIRSQIIRTEFP